MSEVYINLLRYFLLIIDILPDERCQGHTIYNKNSSMFLSGNDLMPMFSSCLKFKVEKNKMKWYGCINFIYKFYTQKKPYTVDGSQ